VSEDNLEQLFGVRYLPAGAPRKAAASETDPYYYETYAGPHDVTVERGDCAYWLGADKTLATLTRGPAKVRSEHFATVVRGYAPETRTSTITNGTVLPYVNGCSTKQIFPPDRPGDPTWQMLLIPPHSSEQAHHIHSTVRSVYVLAGRGTSVVGMNKKTLRTPLEPGMVCILEKMCPHHFETDDASLLVLPVHVWSTSPLVENNHPMFNGTFRM
jgi:hypothetical protein